MNRACKMSVEMSNEAKGTVDGLGVQSTWKTPVRACGRILTRTLLSIALMLGVTIFLAMAILRLADSAFEK